MSRRSLLLAASRFVANPSGGGGPTALKLGSTGYLNTPSGTTLDYNASFTAAGWIYLPTLTDRVLFTISADANNLCDLKVNAAGFLGIENKLAGTYNVSFDDTTAAIAAATWAHVALRRNETLHELQFCLNATQLTSKPASAIARSAATQMWLGSWFGGTDTAVMGLYGWKFWQALRSDAELAAEMPSIPPVQTSGLWGAYHLSGPDDLAEANGAQGAFVATGTATVLAAPTGVS